MQVADKSRSSLFRMFKEYNLSTPSEYVIVQQIEHAKEILRNENHTISDTCYLSGFGYLSHFGKVFKKYVGMTLKEFFKKELELR
ncbi:helix-turn-helix transcriptional regulator [Capnocytophaga sp. ARDL2]|uniref:helix-turn-helix transcriptional regulator n=1 Tax=Capnocytophaga sp. ARDL2 TaxID=3238809 RepID=UPI003557987B